MNVLWYIDVISGFRVPLAPGFAPTYVNGILSTYTASNIFTSYGVGLARDPVEAFKRALGNVSRGLTALGFASSPSISRRGGGYEARYIVGGRSLIVSMRVDGSTTPPIARMVSYIEGDYDPDVLWSLASSIEPVEPVSSVRLQIPDPMRGLEAYSLVAPRGWSVEGRLSMLLDPIVTIVGGGHRVEVGGSRYVYGNGMMFQMVAGQLAAMGFGIGGYIDAGEYASSLGEWRVLHRSSPPPLAMPYLAQVIGIGFMGLWNAVSSVIASSGHESLWVSNMGMQYPIPGELVIEWGSYTARASGPRSLDILLSIMTHLRVNERWVMMIQRERSRMMREMRRSIRATRRRYTPSPSISTYSYSSYESSPPDYSYDTYDTGYDDTPTPDYDTGYGDYDSSYTDDEEKGLRRFRSDTDYTQFYVDNEGQLRSYDHDEEVAARFIEEDGYLRDEEGRIVGRIEDGWVIDEETGERVGILNTRASDDYQLERLEETMLNPRETLGYTPTAPDDEVREDINPYYISKKRGDDED